MSMCCVRCGTRDTITAVVYSCVYLLQVYFADARLDYIEFVNYDGSGRHTVVADDHVSKNSGVQWRLHAVQKPIRLWCMSCTGSSSPCAEGSIVTIPEGTSWKSCIFDSHSTGSHIACVAVRPPPARVVAVRGHRVLVRPAGKPHLSVRQVQLLEPDHRAISGLLASRYHCGASCATTPG